MALTIRKPILIKRPTYIFTSPGGAKHFWDCCYLSSKTQMMSALVRKRSPIIWDIISDAMIQCNPVALLQREPALTTDNIGQEFHLRACLPWTMDISAWWFGVKNLYLCSSLVEKLFIEKEPQTINKFTVTWIIRVWVWFWISLY